MARSLSDQLHAEEPDVKGLDPVEYDGERKHTAFELEHLAFDPTLPIYIKVEVFYALSIAHARWDIARRSRSRSVPVTCSREARALAEGSL